MAVESCLQSNQLNLNHYLSNLDLDNPPSPELFDSDYEDDTFKQKNVEPIPSPVKLTREEMILKSDKMQYKKITKYLCGVPPPPKHTSCTLNCEEMVDLLNENKDYFWISYPEKHIINNSKKILDSNDHSNDSAYPDNGSSVDDQPNDNPPTIINQDEPHKDSVILVENNSATSDTFTMSSVSSTSDSNRSKEFSENDIDERILLLYTSISPNEIASTSFEEAYKHKAFGLHYNRNESVEDFEKLSVRLCDRYISNETQSTCNIWFTSSGKANSVKTPSINLSAKSPGKRLNYLTKRRQTFSLANLQDLTVINKKRLFNYKKNVIRKGKSPRGKSPRGKSPRVKTPRSSLKKRAIRKLTLDGPSPHKSKSGLPKRALFQSPPSSRDGPSQTLPTTTDTNPQSIKRALFSPTNDDKQSKKRKSDEPLDGPRLKWAKSLSFDTSWSTEDKNIKTWQRHSTETTLDNKQFAAVSGKKEMSETHRKKLLWAVAEALRGKGIGMGDPRFKQYATCLARTVKKYMPDLENRHVPRKPGSTTDRMLKLAKHYVYLVIEGKIVA